ncbi:MULTISPECIES: hypothetical protein [unclassified Cytobacillus]|uniref:hypothetical protein n=1 Tax=unclassified Cytobacillus TaxID=2675268 RepID=UPI00203EA565|nr:hypothetical protein [Cytobacillus sp. AMY 15.2]MCM3090566.1 hypothetical protein [Cytobacillus sp. AMY 15.2]
MQKNRSSKQALLFFFIYSALLGSLIFAAATFKPSFQEEQPTEISFTFSKELQIQKHNQEKKAAKNEGKWKPTKTFVITAISIASCLDIIIVLLWARHENKQKQQGQLSNPDRLTNKKWFWYLVSMGIVLPRDGRLTFSLRNFILTAALLVLLKFWMLARLESI